MESTSSTTNTTYTDQRTITGTYFKLLHQKHEDLTSELENKLNLCKSESEKSSFEESMQLNCESYKHFITLAKLGQGAQGEVHKSYDKSQNQWYALKSFRSDETFQIEKRFYINLQEKIPQLFDKYALKLQKFCHIKRELYFQIGICSLKEYNNYLIKNNIKWNEKDLLYILQFLTNFVIDFSEKNSIYHSDIKPENIVIKRNENKQIEIRLIDFGVSTTDFSEIYGFSQGFFHSKNRKYETLSQKYKIPIIESKDERIQIEFFSVARTLLYLMLSNSDKYRNNQSEFVQFFQKCENVDEQIEQLQLNYHNQELVDPIISYLLENKKTPETEVQFSENVNYMQERNDQYLKDIENLQIHV